MIWDVAPEGEDCVAGRPSKLARAARHACPPRRWSPHAQAAARGRVATTSTAQLDLERDTQSALGRTHDYIEGVIAFLQKRPANFKGE